MKKEMFWGKAGLERFIPRFILPVKLIRWKYPKCLKSGKLDNLVLIAGAKKTIWWNSGVSSVYTFLYVDFEGAEFYAARRYVHFKKEVLEEDLFFNE